MVAWQDGKINENSTILQALKIIDDSALQIGIIVDDNDVLQGVITDGDIRRAILRGDDFQKLVTTIMNYHPVSISYPYDKKSILQLMKARCLRQIPVVDSGGKVKDLITWDELAVCPRRDNLIVLMVGGLGTRLRPLTDACPKPLLKVGSKPILETIVDSFIEAGFYRFCFAVNYKSRMIENYFGDGSRFNVEIRYIHEKKRMGTAGALYLLSERPEKDIIVMNGDLLTNVDFSALLDYHKEQQSIATMAVREYSYQVPYGVIDYDGERIVAIKEKPSQSFFVNAGIYVLSPEAVARVDKEEFFDMPELFNQIIADGGKTTAFPIREYWLDIGKMADFERAQSDYEGLF